MDKDALRDLMRIPGVGKSIAQKLTNIGVCSVQELVGRDPEELYAISNAWVGRR
jgi:predicted flap endonuclease-1-like 5' DNA nuclease